MILKCTGKGQTQLRILEAVISRLASHYRPLHRVSETVVHAHTSTSGLSCSLADGQLPARRPARIESISRTKRLSTVGTHPLQTSAPCDDQQQSIDSIAKVDRARSEAEDVVTSMENSSLPWKRRTSMWLFHLENPIFSAQIQQALPCDRLVVGAGCDLATLSSAKKQSVRSPELWWQRGKPCSLV